MKFYMLLLTLLLSPLSRALAHEEGTEITNLAEADWLSPLIAILVIIGAIIFARIIRPRPPSKTKPTTG